MLGRLYGMGRILRLSDAFRQMRAHAYGYDFVSEYEYEISVRMLECVAHLLIICVASEYQPLDNISGLRVPLHVISSVPCPIT